MSTKLKTSIVSAPTTPVKNGKKFQQSVGADSNVLHDKKGDPVCMLESIENELLNKIHIVTPKVNRRRNKPSKKENEIVLLDADADEKATEIAATVVSSLDDDNENKPITENTCVSINSLAKSQEIQSEKCASALHSKRIDITPAVKEVYKVVSIKTGALGGNGYNGAIYGELTIGSMQRVINFLVDRCEMNHQSRFIDVGSGLGKPNFHAAQSPAVRLSLGIELETIRWQLAMHNLDLFVQKYMAQPKSAENKLNGGVNFIAGDIDAAHSLDPFTHIYMYDLGFPPPLQKSIANKFNNSVHARYLVSYRPPRRVIQEYGYNVEYVDSLLTSMFGSGEGHTAYFYKRIGTIPTRSTLPNQKKLTIPKREFISDDVNGNKREEDDVAVACDKAFFDAVYQATCDEQALVETIRQAIDEHLNSGRSRRVTRASSKLQQL